MKEAVKRNFDASVTAYEAYERRTGRFTALTRLLVAEMTASVDGSPWTVLDAGAGSGVSTRVLDECAARTVAVDISAAMLAENGASNRVQADVDALPFRADAFDAVAFTASLFLVPDPAVAVAEASRVLRPGGVVGAVAPLGWFTDDGDDVFASLGRESRSPTPAADAVDAVDEAFETTGGTWRFATTAESVRLFHAIPAMAARLYPRLDPEERVRQTRELLGSLDGTVEERWRWVVGTSS